MSNRYGCAGCIVAAIAILGCTDPENPSGVATERISPQFSQEPGQCLIAWNATFQNTCQAITAQASPALVQDNLHSIDNALWGWGTQLDDMRFCPSTNSTIPDLAPSQPFDITLSSPVTSVYLELEVSGAWYDDGGGCAHGVDATGTLIVYGESGELWRGNIAQIPPTYRWQASYYSPGGINRITQIRYEPGPQHQTVWLTFDYTPPPPPCPETGDPQLDDPLNVEKMDSSFQASNPDSAQLLRKEHFRAGYGYPDGHVVSIDYNVTANNCESADFTFPIEVNGAGLAWIWHSHPYTPGELVAQCLGKAPFKTPVPYPAEPSNRDWDQLDAANYQLFLRGKSPIPGYIWDKKQVIRMTPNVVGETPRYKWVAYDRSVCPQ
jgi:hypothetical protein